MRPGGRGRGGEALFHFPRYSTLTKRVFCILADGRGGRGLENGLIFESRECCMGFTVVSFIFQLQQNGSKRRRIIILLRW